MKFLAPESATAVVIEEPPKPAAKAVGARIIVETSARIRSVERNFVWNVFFVVNMKMPPLHDLN